MPAVIFFGAALAADLAHSALSVSDRLSLLLSLLESCFELILALEETYYVRLTLQPLALPQVLTDIWLHCPWLTSPTCLLP